MYVCVCVCVCLNKNLALNNIQGLVRRKSQAVNNLLWIISYLKTYIALVNQDLAFNEA